MDQSNRQEWTVTGMDCASCAGKIGTALERLDGVSNVSVAVMAERLSLDLSPQGATPADVEAVVRKLGFGIARKAGPAPAQDADPDADHNHDADHDHDHGRSSGALPHDHSHDDPADRGKPWYQTAKGRLVVLTGGLLVLAWIIEVVASERIGAWAFTLACLIGLAPVAKRAFTALRMGQPFTIESLMTLAALGALVIDAAEEAALVVFLFAVGEVLEGLAASKARAGIRALADLVPKTALLEEDGQLREIPAAALRIGQTVLVRPGERVPADGDIIDGESGLDESPVTGESMPVNKGKGDPVFAGAINTQAALRIRVSKAASDNTIARIIRLVEDAEEARAPTERFIDRFSRWYMPLIVALAVLVVLVPPLAFDGAWEVWIYRGLALLLIGCPCALVISVPAAIASGLSAGARKGLLLKGGAVIEAAAATRQIAFDKTGTLTHGRPRVTDLRPAAGLSEDDLLRLAAGVEAGASHPLAQAILSEAKARALMPPPARDAKATLGKGVSATIDGETYWVASPAHATSDSGLAADEQARITALQPELLEDEGKTVVALYTASRFLGLIALRDEPREEARQAMDELDAMGIHATMLTGDNPRTAAAIAEGLGLSFRAQMLPEDKLVAIRQMAGQGGVMMIGDGINDAPALKQADVGVAMGSGTDVALETADAAILRDRLVDIPALIRLARHTMGNIRQNIALALGLKAIFLVTSVFGITGLWIAIMADTGATVLVTLNALRLLRYDPTSPR